MNAVTVRVYFKEMLLLRHLFEKQRRAVADAFTTRSLAAGSRFRSVCDGKKERGENIFKSKAFTYGVMSVTNVPLYAGENTDGSTSLIELFCLASSSPRISFVYLFLSLNLKDLSVSMLLVLFQR